MTLPGNLYAVYPGTVTEVDDEGTPIGPRTFTALQLATAYGVQDEPYVTVVSPTTIPDLDYVKYLHLKPRPDGKYENIKAVAQDDDQNITMGEDFDGSKKYTQETDRDNFDREFLDENEGYTDGM